MKFDLYYAYPSKNYYRFEGNTMNNKITQEEAEKDNELLIRQFQYASDMYEKNFFDIYELIGNGYNMTGRTSNYDVKISVGNAGRIADHIEKYYRHKVIHFEYNGMTSHYYHKGIDELINQLRTIQTNYNKKEDKKMNITIQPSENVKNNWFITETDNPEKTIYHGSIEMIVDWVRFNKKCINYACYQNATRDIGFSDHDIDLFLRQLERLENKINRPSNHFAIHRVLSANKVVWDVVHLAADNIRTCILVSVDTGTLIDWLEREDNIINRIEVYNNGLVIDGNSASDALIYFKTLNNAYKSLSQMYKEENDPVRPKHYHLGAPLEKYQVLDVIISLGYQLPLGEAFCLTNALTYLMRYPKKNGLEDVKKAQFYINKLIELMEQK